MSPEHPSRTALATAYLRAAHQLLDAEPKLLDDPVALTLLGPEAPQQIQAAAGRYGSAEARGLRAHVILRSRFAEDRLKAAVERGIAQYVILGAGFDTFAYRQPEWATALRIVEVDGAATQQVKRAMLRAAGISEPANVAYADIDLESEPLRAGLQRHHLQLDTPTFFSWLGVTMYLKPETVDDVLQTIAAFPAGSEVVLTFAWPKDEAEPGDRPSSLAERAARAGEPWLTFFLPPALEQKLRAFGFTRVRFLTPAESEQQYFSARPDDLPAPRIATIMTAVR